MPTFNRNVSLYISCYVCVVRVSNLIRLLLSVGLVGLLVLRAIVVVLLVTILAVTVTGLTVPTRLFMDLALL